MRIMVIVHVDEEDISDLRFAVRNIESAEITFQCPIIEGDGEE